MDWIHNSFDKYCHMLNNNCIKEKCKIVENITAKQWVNDDATDDSPPPPSPIALSPPPTTPPNFANYLKINQSKTQTTKILNSYSSLHAQRSLPLSYTTQELEIHSLAAVE